MKFLCAVATLNVDN